MTRTWPTRAADGRAQPPRLARRHQPAAGRSSTGLTLDIEPGLRLGLLLDAGWGLPLDPRCAPRCEAAARRFEAAGAIVEPLAPFTARARWPRASTASGACVRGWTSRRCRRARQAKVLPFIRDWVARGART
jgi:Asp-tRNA(Asn)/Glu-tRNA(Gln) amidotransferase A subunit family amidase